MPVVVTMLLGDRSRGDAECVAGVQAQRRDHHASYRPRPEPRSWSMRVRVVGLVEAPEQPPVGEVKVLANLRAYVVS